MPRWLVGLAATGLAACGHAGPQVAAPAPARAGCYALGPEATASPFRFPDTLQLAADWFLPDDSTGGRLRVVRPRDASLATYRTYGGRFWWESRGDSIFVTRSDGQSGAVLTAGIDANALVGTLRAFGPTQPDASLAVRAPRVPCDASS